eukprot:c17574_g1_i2.p1 GENE.c17574_g1_i2~~c17574_g1_i2.p1  ORF type:complete len:339 (+),score=59.92 c17574_g1_i2:336-1352(+)
MPLHLAEVVVSAFVGYGCESPKASQRGLYFHDLVLMSADLCSDDPATQVDALFRLMTAHPTEEILSIAKFRMVVPLLVRSAVHMDSMTDKRSPLPFESCAVNADVIQALSRQLFPDDTHECTRDQFSVWCERCACALTKVMRVPLPRLMSPALSIANQSAFIPSLIKPQRTSVDQSQLWLLSAFMPNVPRTARQVFNSLSSDRSEFESLTSPASTSPPLLIVIVDDAGFHFGAFVSGRPASNKGPGFIPDENAYVFRLSPNFEVFPVRSLRGNEVLQHVVYYGDDGFGLGGEKGRMTLFVDSDLATGHSFPTEVFDTVTCVSSYEDFEIQSVEVWVCE